MRWETMKRLTLIHSYHCFMDFKNQSNEMDEETLDLSEKNAILKYS